MTPVLKQNGVNGPTAVGSLVIRPQAAIQHFAAGLSWPSKSSSGTPSWSFHVKNGQTDVGMDFHAPVNPLRPGAVTNAGPLLLSLLAEVRLALLEEYSISNAFIKLSKSSINPGYGTIS